MKSKTLALTLVTMLIALTCVPAAFAQDSVLPGGPVVIQVNATGTIDPTTDLTVDAGSGLDFTPGTGALIATADQVVTVNFTDNHAGFQTIIVSTNNPTVVDPGTGLTVVRSGLITDATGAETASVPLHWVVYDGLTDAQSYLFEDNVFPPGFIQEGTDVSGKIDNRFNFYVVDRHQSDFNTSDVLGFASVVAGVTNEIGSLANAPVDTAPTVDDDGNPATPSQNDGTQRETNDGEVFMKLGADYHGAPAASYYTNTLTLDLITIG